MKSKTFFYFSCVLTCLAIIVSCQKTDLGQPASANDVYSGSLGAFFAEELANMTESGTIDASAGGQITLSDGTVVTIPNDSITCITTATHATKAVHIAKVIALG